MTKIYWGDIHAHCAASYGNGTPQRAIDNARQHLDFCSITGHAFWPDMPMDLETQNRVIGMHLGGFAKLQQHYWPQVIEELENANQDGQFVVLPSYEWHSMEYGDYNCYFDSTDVELIDAPTPEKLFAEIQRQPADAMILPHHCGYVRGYRGINWEGFDARRSPLMEVFSNHGCCEADDAYYEYHHSMGPRVGESTLREGLLMGHRFGFYASTAQWMHVDAIRKLVHSLVNHCGGRDKTTDRKKSASAFATPCERILHPAAASGDIQIVRAEQEASGTLTPAAKVAKGAPALSGPLRGRCQAF